MSTLVSINRPKRGSNIMHKTDSYNCLLATGLKLDNILKLNLIKTNFDFRESNGGNDFETYNKAQKSASAAQLNYGARCFRGVQPQLSAS